MDQVQIVDEEDVQLPASLARHQHGTDLVDGERTAIDDPQRQPRQLSRRFLQQRTLLAVRPLETDLAGLHAAQHRKDTFRHLLLAHLDAEIKRIPPRTRRLKRHVQSHRRLSHRRPPGEHRQFAPVKAARQVVQFVEPGTHLYMFPFFACLLVTERTRQDFACHLGRHPDIHASGGVFTQAVHVVCDTGEELHHVDIRLLRLQAAFVQARHTAAQHPFALYQTHIFVDVAVVAHRLQHGA